MYRLFLVLLLTASSAFCMSEPFARIVRFGSADGLSESYVSHGIQDSYGYIWFCTRDGLVQYDGYRFKTYKSRPGDDCPLKSNRIDFVEELPDHNLRCHSAGKYYIFYRDTRRFELLPDTTVTNFHGIPDVDEYVRRVKLIPEYRDVNLKVRLVDNQGGIWIRSFRGLERVEFRREPIRNIKLSPEKGDEHVSCLFVDSRGRLWVGDKNRYLHIFDKGSSVPLYLAPDGRISKSKTAFGHIAYTVFEDSRGLIWIGTKPDGLFCLTPCAGGYRAEQYLNDPADLGSISSSKVYSVCEDACHRIWIGTYGGGLNMLYRDRRGRVRFINKNNLLRKYPSDDMDHIRCMSLVKGGILLIGTTNGLITTRPGKNPAAMSFFVSRRIKGDITSLSNNNITGMQQDASGNVFVSTNGGGVSRGVSVNLLRNDIRFKNFTTVEGMATDACLNIFLDCRGCLWSVGEMSLMQMNMITGLFTNHVKGLFSNGFLFTEAKPVCLPDGNMVFATNQGILKFNVDDIKKSVFIPKIRFACPDTLVVEPDGNSFAVEFAALDYGKNEDIIYMYKMEGLDDTWIYTKDNKIHFSALPPGRYRFVIRSTNSDGVWVDNEESIMISLLYLKSKSLLGMSPNNYILDYRIMKARQMLAHTGAVVSEVAFACGFSDPKYFCRCFKKVTGQTPSEYGASAVRRSAETAAGEDDGRNGQV